MLNRRHLLFAVTSMPVALAAPAFTEMATKSVSASLEAIEKMTTVKEVEEAYHGAIRNYGPDLIKSTQQEHISSSDGPQIVYAKQLYLKLVELGHGVTDFRRPFARV